MTERQLLLLKNSWSFMMVRSQEAGTLFYLKLFEALPLLRQSAKNDLREQSGRLMYMITLILTKFQHPDDILNEIRNVPEWRRRYGLKDSEYTAVGECILFTLRKSLGELFTTDTEEAWKAAFAVIRTSYANKNQVAA